MHWVEREDNLVELHHLRICSAGPNYSGQIVVIVCLGSCGCAYDRERERACARARMRDRIREIARTKETDRARERLRQWKRKIVRV